jgi:hypothetical protein
MAVATLGQCYNNEQVFAGVVKIRKGLAVRMILDSTSMDSIMMIFDQHLREVQAAIPDADPNAKYTRETVDKGLSVCNVLINTDGCLFRSQGRASVSPMNRVLSLFRFCFLLCFEHRRMTRSE